MFTTEKTTIHNILPNLYRNVLTAKKGIASNEWVSPEAICLTFKDKKFRNHSMIAEKNCMKHKLIKKVFQKIAIGSNLLKDTFAIRLIN